MSNKHDTLAHWLDFGLGDRLLRPQEQAEFDAWYADLIERSAKVQEELDRW
jgi:hypothetical protein